MKPNIDQIRKLLAERNYLADKYIDVSQVRTGKEYEFICDKGHVFTSLVSNVFQTGKFGCPICSGRRVLKGYNDLWTTHPKIAAMLKDPEDGYKYNAGSNKRLTWICPDCGTEKSAMPAKVTIQNSLCTLCSSDTSYPEKFITNLLQQFSISFEKEKTFEWSANKRYDFYIPFYDCIVETHGKQHYSDIGFSNLAGKTYIDEQLNDFNKQLLAKEIGKITNYIVIDCRKSELLWLKGRTKESGLLEVLQIIPETVDWEECHEFALSNLTKAICDAYEKEGQRNLKELGARFNLSRGAVLLKLKQGNLLGWCSYDPQAAITQARKDISKRTIQLMSKPVYQLDKSGAVIAEFPSIQEAQRQLVISHIWDCIVGRRQTCGGYKWRYKNDS
jgi:hypothetical protein